MQNDHLQSRNQKIRSQKIMLGFVAFTDQLSELENKYDKQFNDVNEVLNCLIKKDGTEKAECKKIGYKS